MGYGEYPMSPEDRAEKDRLRWAAFDRLYYGEEREYEAKQPQEEDEREEDD